MHSSRRCLASASMSGGLLLLLGCVAHIDGGTGDAVEKTAGQGDPTNGDRPSDTGSLSDASACDERSVGRTPLLRLTQKQYVHAIFDLFSIERDSDDGLPEDEKFGTFRNNISAPVASLDVDKYFQVAEEVAVEVAARVESLIPCNRAALGDAACVDSFVRTFGQRVFRRPLDDVEVTELNAIYERHAAEGYQLGIQLVATALLASPHFLYRVELSDQGFMTPLSGYELASRLSFFLWDSAPDERLLEAAARGDLESEEGLSREMDRLLTDPRLRDMLETFHSQWLGIDSLQSKPKDAALFPTFDATLARSMQLDSARFAAHVFMEGDGRLESLLTAPLAFADGPLSLIYGIDASDETVATPLDATLRGGLFLQPAFLAAHSHANQTSPVLRGMGIRLALLCSPPPPPPPDVNTVAPEPAPDASTRERFAAHTESPGCAGCHELLDPIGFGFEHYDAIGRYREFDGGLPVDATGAVAGGGDADGTFSGGVELMQRLAQSEQVQECVTKHWFQYGIGRGNAGEDHCSLFSAHQSFKASDFDLRELVRAIVLSDAFRFRRAP